MAERNHKPTARSHRDLKRRYGITESQYNEMLAKQKGRCGICGRYRKLSVDHSHSTRKVRGLLCSNCNSGLGLLKESIAVMQRAIQYLTKHKE